MWFFGGVTVVECVVNVGVLAVVFSGLNNTPRFWDLFCWLLVLGVFRLGVGHLKLSLGRTTLGRATAKDRFSRRLVIR